MLGASNQYVFKVAKTSSKLEIKKSIEELYNVEVEKVNVVNLPAKKRRLGKQIGIRPGVKKAVVTLKSGSSIQLN
ncbi:MAG: 50S ribosomal protein L23 [Candidatus Yanofskybacteria bacterium CG10_big_fil_rev_8_21_14_0_10_36_16]|uniref:50S ribosomal protein L23 n=1 Tax=Candidatus Yanofskybacteria bacterium CG10_big_fil_rev_8_21_14_0_10_36_16 TaxID=1975096 RepID=A0A2J0Q8B8_9BACT|nr:MAG: 50S ribosomal protein L23 [Candidatus Yanofskybacteria bacterium CG10_big_fil_rev_8_21_14_0_10_36_16]